MKLKKLNMSWVFVITTDTEWATVMSSAQPSRNSG